MMPRHEVQQRWIILAGPKKAGLKSVLVASAGLVTQQLVPIKEEAGKQVVVVHNSWKQKG